MYLLTVVFILMSVQHSIFQKFTNAHSSQIEFPFLPLPVAPIFYLLNEDSHQKIEIDWNIISVCCKKNLVFWPNDHIAFFILGYKLVNLHVSRTPAA